MYVAVAVGDGADSFSGVIRLNETGKRVFELLMQGKDADSIVSAMLDEYDSDAETMRHEVSRIIDALNSEGAIEM